MHDISRSLFFFFLKSVNALTTAFTSPGPYVDNYELLMA